MTDDIGAITAVKARYFRFLDLKQWDEVRGLFTADATFEHPTIGAFDDIDAAVDAVRSYIGDMFTVHEGSLPDITVLGPDRATAVFAMSSHSLPAAAGGLVRTFGHYHDDLRRVDGAWRLSALKLVSTYREPRTPS